ncbi:glycosyltransferase family 2 protein [Psychroserpens ponticola]|uniref:Glycosyltransferase family 2 protein n=1 Tax=Psychroserpens ponticola TaxID=2932268 RepID=A0ABY7RZE6_9FLAO|nr:glycosyltransferase family 2 protein [Psychroserpens ponticola]WCO02519.1 glycosyltransferase family 2 protein [Psychroserpens ponticola]
MNKKISFVVPVYFEEDVISRFILEMTEELKALNLDYEIVFIDDGSTDKTVQIIKEHAIKNNNLKLIELSYNHGKQAALTAGIKNASGDYLLYMDPDLQDPPKEIGRFIQEIEKGYDLVFGVRKEKKDTFLNSLFSKIFWGVLRRFTGLDLPKGLAVMRIFNRKFADKFLEYQEQNRFIEGIFVHIGMKQSVITIEQRERYAGTSKFNFRKKMELAFNAIFDFSELPLKIAVRLGAAFIIVGILILLIIVFLKIYLVDFQSGWPSIIGALIIATGIQLFFLGIAALYIGKIYKESKGRPLFSIREMTNFE